MLGYDAPDYRNRYLTLPALDDDCVQPETLLSRSALQINATVMCISEAHSLLDLFLQVPIERLQMANNTYYVRAIYALVALLRADYAVGTDAEGTSCESLTASALHPSPWSHLGWLV